MSQLDQLIDRWVRSLAASEPRLESHLHEISDHVRTDAQSRIDAGAGVADAFAAAVGAFGAPRDVAVEFLKSALPGRRQVLTYAGAWLLLGVAIAAAVVIADTYFALDVTWVAIGLTNVLMLPAIAIPFYIEWVYREQGIARHRGSPAHAR